MIHTRLNWFLHLLDSYVSLLNVVEKTYNKDQSFSLHVSKISFDLCLKRLLI